MLWFLYIIKILYIHTTLKVENNPSEALVNIQTRASEGLFSNVNITFHRHIQSSFIFLIFRFAELNNIFYSLKFHLFF